MRDCNSLASVLKQLQSALPLVVPARSEPPIDLELMHAGANLGAISQAQSGEPISRWTKLVALLFCHPGAALTRSEIIPNLDHFHLRSGLAMDGYCMGYGADWPADHYVNRSVVADVGGQTWLFSEQAFCDAIAALEAQTRWRYSGECELILLTAVASPGMPVRLGYESAIVCNLEAMLADRAISSVRAFLGVIFAFANSAICDDATWRLSDAQGLKVAGSFLKDSVLGLLPKALAEGYRKAEHLAIKDISISDPTR